eukprot:3455561-Rhodomonas_salina.1
MAGWASTAKAKTEKPEARARSVVSCEGLRGALWRRCLLALARASAWHNVRVHGIPCECMA